QLAQMDGFILVVRAFESDMVMHPSGSVDPKRDVESMLSELLLNDLVAVERKVEELADEKKKGGTDKALNENQSVLFTRLHEALNGGIPLRKLEYTPEDEKELSSYGLLSRKPVLVVFNMGEAQSAPQMALDVPSVALMGKLEMEIAQLPADDAAMFMEE